MKRLLFSLITYVVALVYLSAMAEANNSLPDTLLTEDVDASDIILSFKFAYHESDTAENRRLLEEQSRFLRAHRMPTNGVEELRGYNTRDHKKLIKEYRMVLDSLSGHKYRDLYAQICSQIIIKYLCSENIMAETHLSPPNNKLIYFLSEMKNYNGINIGLIYTGFLKLQYLNRKDSVCYSVKEYISYASHLLNEKEQEVKAMGETQNVAASDVDKFILNELTRRLEIDREYVDKLNILQVKSCQIQK